MKKKILALVMAAAMTLGLTACGGGDSSSAGSAASTGLPERRLRQQCERVRL